MSSQAVILKSDSVIKVENFSAPEFFIDGRLSGFKNINGDKYLFCQKIKVDDIGLDQERIIEEGYYNEILYLEFKSENSISSYNSLALSKFDKLFISATQGDEILVQKLKLKTPYNDQSNLTGLIKYKLQFSPDITLFDSDGNIIEPENQNDIENIPLNLVTEARQFYFSNIVNVDNISDISKKYECALTLAKISIYINNIVNKIFPILNNTEFSTIKSSQLTYWSNNVFVDPTINVFEEYLKNIRNFYKIAYDNKLKYSDLPGLDKLYYLVLGMSPDTISILTTSNKIKLLDYISKKHLSNTWEILSAENLVIKISVAFNEGNLNDIDTFMESLISTKSGTTGITLYEILYSKMSTSTNLVEGVYGLMHAVFGTNFKPTKTKFQFVQAIYELWKISKYNPFNQDNTYKPNTMGLKSSEEDLVQINSNVNTDNFTFNYTNYIAFDPKYEDVNVDGVIYPAITDYLVKRPDASPLVIPYYSREEFGIFFDDFTFKLSGEKIEVLQQLKPVLRIPDTSTPDPDDYLVYNQLRVIEKLYGSYHMYQPVTLLNINIETKLALSFATGDDVIINGQKINALIPIFVLKFIDDNGDRSDIETLVGYFVDVTTTFAGFSNLTKLRHLKWAATGLQAGDIGLFTIDGLRIVVGGVEFGSGVLSFLGNFVECDQNDSFCNGVKTFLNVLQLACLSVNVGDGIASLAAKRQASELVEIANTNGTPGADPIDNLTDALGGTTEANEAAHTILQFASSSSQFQSIRSIVDSVRELLNNPKTGLFEVSRQLIGPLFIKSHYTASDITEIVTHLLSKANVFGPQFNKLCAQILFIGSKEGKLITKEQLIKQITFFYDEVLKRGFSSGFNSLNNYKLFCNKTRLYFTNNFKFWDDDLLEDVVSSLNDHNLTQYIDNYWSTFDFTKRVELIVQGSAVRKYKNGEILEHLDLNDVPSGNPGDFEFALRMNPRDFEVFTYIAREFSKNKLETTFDFGKVSKKGFMKLEEIESLFGKRFVNQLRQSVGNDVNFSPNKINFAIVKGGGPYDLEPNLIFKY